MKNRIYAALLAVVLLASCSASAAAPLPSLEPFSRREIGERLSGGPNYAFEPGAYGAVYPYVGLHGKHLFYDDYVRYGFAAADGTILCEPVYSAVTLLTAPDGTSVYLARRDNEIRYGDWDEWSALLARREAWSMDVIAADGSFAFGYQDILDAGSGYLTVFSGGQWGVTDYYGNTIIAPEDGSAYPMYAGLTEQGARFIKSRVERDGANPDVRYCYVDENGAVAIPETELYYPIMGVETFESDPVQFIMLRNLAFSCGLAARFAPDGRYGFIGGDGEWVVPPDYPALSDPFNYVNAYENDRVIVRSETDGIESFSILDTDGNALLTLPYFIERYWRGSEQEVFTSYDDATGGAAFYDRGGARLTLPEGASYVEYGGCGWFAAQFAGETRFYRGGEFRFAVTAELGYTGVGSGSPDTVVVTEYGQRGAVRVYSADGTVLYEWLVGDENSTVYTYFVGDYYRIYRENFGEYEYRKYGAVSADGQRVIEAEYDVLTKYGDYFAVRRGNYGGLINSSGEWVVKLWLASD